MTNLETNTNKENIAFVTVVHVKRGSYEGSSIVIVDIFDFLTVLHLKRGSYEGSKIYSYSIFVQQMY